MTEVIVTGTKAITACKCDLCGSGNYQKLFVAEKYVGGNSVPVVCGNCGFLYVKDRRAADEIANSWSDEIYPTDGYDPNWPGVKARLFYVAEYFDQLEGWRDKNVLEIGAGRGWFLNEVRNRGADVWGVEPSHENCKTLNLMGIPNFPGIIEDYPITQKFDVVCILWTLENCRDCIAMLMKAYDCLKSGGKLLVATGSRILVPFKKPLGSYFSTNPADTHCFRFSKNTLEAALYNASLAATFNDYLQNDVMIAVGAKSNSVEGRGLPFDAPDAVIEHFNQWEKLSENWR
ncbi:hypothetical protein LCGC14_1899800 [marine sediment metagenome]|uniref:Methyltransferase type 11 domain-containing protein n=1 Tax=marine sediment metagenome TaxID=412755 RepID=A0A0F9FWY9_9ZZZZ